VIKLRAENALAVLPFDRFDNLQKVKKVHCPVLVIHGTQDSVINVVHGRELLAAANEPKQAFWVDGANHNDVAFVGGARHSDALKAFAILIQRHQLDAGSQRL
jgi:abhydrolase domain-containing protein 17